jgi:predicted transcriptional regulator
VMRLTSSNRSLKAFIRSYVGDSEARNRADAIAGIQRGLDDFEAGRFRSLEEFAEEKRRQYNLPTNS